MKTLSGEQLREIVHNVWDIYFDSEGFLCFSRFTARQQEQYQVDSHKGNVDYYKRTFASSNVVLDFITDSDHFGIYYRWLSATGYDATVFDLYVDGRLAGYRTTENKSHDIICFDLPEGEHRITLFLPWQVTVKIKSVVLSDNATVKEVKREKRILSFGDSITQGYHCKHPSLCYIGCMTRAFDAECLNQGIGGYWFKGASLDLELRRWKPDLITVAYGSNDYTIKDTAEEFKAGAESFLKALHEIFPDTPVLGILPIYRSDELFIARQKMVDYSLENSREVLIECYGKYSNTYVLEDRFFPSHADFFASDLTHPNDLGFMVYGEAVTAKIREIMHWG